MRRIEGFAATVGAATLGLCMGAWTAASAWGQAPPAEPAPQPVTSAAPAAEAPAAPTPAPTAADLFAEAADRACNAIKDGRPVVDALSGLQVLAEEVKDLPAKGAPVWALRSMTQAAFVTGAEGSACYVVSAPSLTDPAARDLLSAVVRRIGAEGAPEASPAPVAAPPAPVAPPVPAAPAAAASSALFNDLAPGAASAALTKVCDAALRGGQPIGTAASAVGLAVAATAPAYPLPNYSVGGTVYRVPSNDGEMMLFDKPDDPKSCHLTIAHVPPMVADILADRLAEGGMKKGAFGPMGDQGRFQQLVSADGKTYANIVAFEPKAGVDAPPVRVYVQWGMN